jgi:hypothetical protein
MNDVSVMRTAKSESLPSSKWFGSDPVASVKADPQTLELRAQPRPVVRLNRRVLAVGVGALAAVVLGGTVWSRATERSLDSWCRSAWGLITG